MRRSIVNAAAAVHLALRQRAFCTHTRGCVLEARCASIALTTKAHMPWASSIRWMTASPKKKARRAADEAAQTARLSARRKLTVALVGRPNVGKSRLFNRLVGRKLAIVNATPGTTRDWKEMDASLGDLEFVVMDTGGLEDKPARDSVEAKMQLHTAQAVKHADVVLFIMDAREGVTPEDMKVNRWLSKVRPEHSSTYLLANKAEALLMSGDTEAGISRWDALERDTYELGLGPPIPISAEHGDGMAELYNVLVSEAETVPGADNAAADIVDPTEGSSVATTEISEDSTETETVSPSPPDSRVIELAIVGRPNVGKSTLVNQLLGEERVLAGPTPGLTRDVTHVTIPFNGATIRLVDTAGMRRWGSWDLTTPLEGEAVGAAKKALQRAQVVAVVVDASAGAGVGLTDASPRFLRGDKTPTAAAPVSAPRTSSRASASDEALRRGNVTGLLTRQDLAIMEQILREGRALVVVLNKIDAVPDRKAATAAVREQLDAMHDGRGVPVVPVSALAGQGVSRLLPAVVATYEQWNTRIPTTRLNNWLDALSRHHPPPTITVSRPARGAPGSLISRRIPLRIKYLTQTGIRPPSFTAFVNRSPLPESYKRFILNSLREEFKMHGVPIRFAVRTAANPYARSGGDTTTSLSKHKAAAGAQQRWKERAARRQENATARIAKRQRSLVDA